ncbi:MAG: FAD-dependent oxidoreductase [Bryobacteraceae bacterium]|nr:FAD-dependent oxidoreductase [Bryobacteraceae bacterium]
MGARTELLIAGGGTGGVAAALAAARNGRRVIVLEETAWIGGQFTSQGVPPDEHGWIEEFGCTRSYRHLREGIRDYYRRYYPLREEYRAQPRLNPGNGWVSPLCHEPRVSLAVMEAMLAPYVASGQVEIWYQATVTSLDVAADRVRAAGVHRQGREQVVEADFFLDATELGDLLPLANCEHESGSPSRPDNNQAFSWCFAMEHFPGEDHRISKPASFDYWRDYIPRLTPAWPGPLLSWTVPHPRTMEPLQYRFEPHREAPRAFSGLWSYRRLRDQSLHREGTFRSDICLVNWPLIDYLDGDLLTAKAEDRTRHLAAARQMSLCVFYWLQQQHPGLRLAPRVLGTEDGFALAPYIRESRRIRALRTIREEDVSAEHRTGATLAEPYADSVGIGYYRIDLHPSTGGDNYVDVPALPFRIPLGALIPVRLKNLLPAAKNIGTTHVTNGCYRLHPVEWNIGEAAALLAHWCLATRQSPHAAAGQPAAFQEFLREEGLELAWPEDLLLEEGDAHRHAH